MLSVAEENVYGQTKKKFKIKNFPRKSRQTVRTCSSGKNVEADGIASSSLIFENRFIVLFDQISSIMCSIDSVELDGSDSENVPPDNELISDGTRWASTSPSESPLCLKKTKILFH